MKNQLTDQEARHWAQHQLDGGLIPQDVLERPNAVSAIAKNLPRPSATVLVPTPLGVQVCHDPRLAKIHAAEQEGEAVVSKADKTADRLDRLADQIARANETHASALCVGDDMDQAQTSVTVRVLMDAALPTLLKGHAESVRTLANGMRSEARVIAARALADAQALPDTGLTFEGIVERRTDKLIEVRRPAAVEE